jgi:1,5-anhydro-D-fructose reductase (1,5-anhydro-D-mannitol-forming)
MPVSHPLSIALLGLWHVHADGYAEEAARHPGTRLEAVWDPDPASARQAASRLGTAVAPDLDELLARDDLAGVIVTAATADHHDVIGRALNAGKAVFTEKLLAPTVEEAEDLVRLAEQRGVALLVSLPRLEEGPVLAAGRLLDDGALGELTYVRVRMAHDGWIDGWLPDRFGDRADAVGGALTDLGAHPAYLVQRFLGARPATVQSTYTSVSGHEVEDNAVVTVTYPGGAIGVIEASNVTVPGASAFELRGTRGTLLYGFGGERLLGKGDAFEGGGWVEVPLPGDGPSPFEQWVAAIRTGTGTATNLAAAVDLTRLVVAANEAAAAHALARPGVPVPA